VADGLNFLYYTGHEYDQVFGAWDWQLLPGITCEHNPALMLPCTKPFPLLGTTFVGGVSNGMYGACGMQLRSHSVTAQKSYMFFDHEYVAMTNNIQCSSQNPVYTTVTSMPSRGVVMAGNSSGEWVVEGRGVYNAKWVHHHNTGYIFVGPDPVPVHINHEIVKGNWIRSGATDEAISMKLVTVYIDNTPRSGMPYAVYIVAPDVPVHKMAQLSAREAGIVTQYSPAYHAAMHASTSHPYVGIMHAIFWQAGSVSFDSDVARGWHVHVDQSCMITIEAKTNGEVTFSASHPTEASLLLQIHINRALHGSSCTTTLSSTDGNDAASIVHIKLGSDPGVSASAVCHSTR
jgi:chondroitin AC lyase